MRGPVDEVNLCPVRFSWNWSSSWCAWVAQRYGFSRKWVMACTQGWPSRVGFSCMIAVFYVNTLYYVVLTWAHEWPEETGFGARLLWERSMWVSLRRVGSRAIQRTYHGQKAPWSELCWEVCEIFPFLRCVSIVGTLSTPHSKILIIHKPDIGNVMFFS